MTNEQVILIEQLEAAKREQTRCMGGIDPAGCVAASKHITELRGALRDPAAFVQHLNQVLAHRL